MEVHQYSKRPKWFKPVQFPDFYRKITTNFRQFFKQQNLIDTIFHCENNETIGFHKLILIQASPILRKIFYEFGPDSFNDDNVIHISIPEVRKEVMSDFLEALYLGAVPTDLNIFQEFSNLSDLFMIFCEYVRPESPEIQRIDIKNELVNQISVDPRFSDQIASIETSEV